MNKATGLNLCTLICLLALAKFAFAEGPAESGFLDDYSRLQPAEADWVDYIYISDGFRERLAEARTLMIPQPEMFLAPDSKYKGMKPDDMKVITDSMRQLVVEAFADGYQVADSPGPNTLAVNMAFTNLYLKKKPRIPVVGWLPPAYVVTTAKRAVLDEFTKNVLLTELVWEGEITDSETGEVLAQIILELGNRRDKKDFTSWDELVVAMAVSAKRLRCRFDNAPLPESGRRDCLEITDADIDFVE